jgi:hypothetical protein
MAQSILIFDFGTNEEAAQQARHKIEAWQQGSRLGKKILLKFDRDESTDDAPSDAAASTERATAKGKSGKKKAAKHEQAPGPDGALSKVRLVIRLDFSDHEKLTQQRWLDRFAVEEPFKSAKGETIRQGSPAFIKTAELFDSLG